MRQILKLPGWAPKKLPPLLLSERLVLSLTAGILLIALILVVARGSRVDWFGYLTIMSAGLGVLGLGLFYRATQRNEDIATTLVSAAAFILFTGVASGFNYTLLPIWRAPIDVQLASMDAILGFHWPDVMAFVVKWPFAFEVMRYAYLSSLPQLALLIALLGLSGRTNDLQVLIVAATLAACMTVGSWLAFPSFGTSTLYSLPPEVLQLNPIVGPSYGRELLRLASDGPSLISPSNALGLIAAPSYHIVMALLAIHASRNLPRVRWPFLAINLLIIPATIVHGGHHLVDLAAGAIVSILGVVMARAYLDRPHDRRIEANAAPATLAA